MPWTENDYPDRFKGLDPDVRSNAIEIANRLVDEGVGEERAIAVAESRAREGGTRASDPVNREGQRVEDAQIPREEDEEALLQHEPEEPDVTEEADPAAPQETRSPREGPEDLAPEEDAEPVERTLREDPPPEGSPEAPSESVEGPERADRDQLEHWPRDRLLEYARQRGVDADPQVDRNALIDRLSRGSNREA